jgi:hypothetical protein
MSESVPIHWLANVVADPSSGRFAVARSNLASVRLRAGALATIDTGMTVSFGDLVSACPKILVVGKIGANDLISRSARWLEGIERVRRSGGTIVCDYTDHHLGFDSSMSEFYRKTLALSDLVVVPSEAMMELVRPFCRLPILVIPDAIESPIISPSVPASSSRTVLWFGHGSNLAYLLRWISEFECAAERLKLTLRILVDSNSVDRLRQSRLVSRMPFQLVVGTWSLTAMIDAARVCDLCIIPSDPSDPKKRGVSSNRLLTALSLGLPVGADGVASYQEFRDFYIDLRSSAFTDLLKDPASGHKAVLAAQSEILPRFSMSSIGNQWAQSLLSLRQPIR